MKITLLDVAGFEPAIRAMRLPMKSGEKSDSEERYCALDYMAETSCPWKVSKVNYCRRSHECVKYLECYQIGEKDRDLSLKLCTAGSDHRKHIRLIDAWMEITAPLYWWKEFDTYRMGVDKVSESTMHTLMKKPLTVEDFEAGPGTPAWWYLTQSDETAYDPRSTIEWLNTLIKKEDFEALNAVLPQSYLQTRICKVSYEALRNMYSARKNHKLKEWRQFCEWMEKLPYSEFIIGERPL